MGKSSRFVKWKIFVQQTLDKKKATRYLLMLFLIFSEIGFLSLPCKTVL